MTHAQRVLQLGAFADGEVAPADRPVIEQYLASDSDAVTDVEARRALRLAVHQALQKTGVPDHVRQRVAMMLRREQQVAKTRGIRLAVAGSFAAAAMIMLTVSVLGPSFLENTFVAPPPASEYPVAVASLIELHEQCDGAIRNELGLAGKPVSVVNRAIRNSKLFSREELHVPDLSKVGFELADVCRCDVAPSADGLLVTYQNPATGHRLSISVCSRPLTLRSGSASLADVERGGRHYERADLRDGLAVAKWDERYCSVVLCAQMPASDLLKIADTIQMFKSGGASLAVMWL